MSAGRGDKSDVESRDALDRIVSTTPFASCVAAAAPSRNPSVCAWGDLCEVSPSQVHVRRQPFIEPARARVSRCAMGYKTSCRLTHLWSRFTCSETCGGCCAGGGFVQVCRLTLHAIVPMGGQNARAGAGTHGRAGWRHRLAMACTGEMKMQVAQRER